MLRPLVASLAKLSVREPETWTPNTGPRPHFGGADGDHGAFADGTGRTARNIPVGASHYLFMSPMVIFKTREG
jgi:hypothetical protein